MAEINKKVLDKLTDDIGIPKKKKKSFLRNFFKKYKKEIKLASGIVSGASLVAVIAFLIKLFFNSQAEGGRELDDDERLRELVVFLADRIAEQRLAQQEEEEEEQPQLDDILAPPAIHEQYIPVGAGLTGGKLNKRDVKKVSSLLDKIARLMGIPRHKRIKFVNKFYKKHKKLIDNIAGGVAITASILSALAIIAHNFILDEEERGEDYRDDVSDIVVESDDDDDEDDEDDDDEEYERFDYTDTRGAGLVGGSLSRKLRRRLKKIGRQLGVPANKVNNFVSGLYRKFKRKIDKLDKRSKIAGITAAIVIALTLLAKMYLASQEGNDWVEDGDEGVEIFSPREKQEMIREKPLEERMRDIGFRPEERPLRDKPKKTPLRVEEELILGLEPTERRKKKKKKERDPFDIQFEPPLGIEGETIEEEDSESEEHAKKIADMLERYQATREKEKVEIKKEKKKKKKKRQRKVLLEQTETKQIDIDPTQKMSGWQKHLSEVFMENKGSGKSREEIRKIASEKWQKKKEEEIRKASEQERKEQKEALEKVESDVSKLKAGRKARAEARKKRKEKEKEKEQKEEKEGKEDSDFIKKMEKIAQEIKEGENKPESIETLREKAELAKLEKFQGMGLKKPNKKKANKWITHLKKYHKEHPKLSYKQAMVEAKKTYKK
jgi:hypothetical protein